MTIKEAKKQIENAMQAYFTKDDSGEYIVPIENQRPVFLMGPPGIGKTAIMSQIAADMGVGLLSYSMTHHTRQSALGLPLIKHKTYQGKEYDISEYTMSEIIASIYDMMEETGVREGILFLDEVNCVSETLTPIMLQFLQYKVFGRHRVPDGWIVVTAGNPAEYNDSVRDFDIVTWDRLKRIDVEADYDVWKEYAWAKGLHPAVLSYLEVRKKDFYKVETTVSGKAFATARGWEDLSQMIQLYEMHDIAVDEDLVRQYIQDPHTAKNFAMYYGLYRTYESDYQVTQILEGKAPKEIVERAKKAKFDERLALLGMLTDAVTGEAKKVMELQTRLSELAGAIREYRTRAATGAELPRDVLKDIEKRLRAEAEAGLASRSMKREAVQRLRRNADELVKYEALVGDETAESEAFKPIKKEYDKDTKQLKKDAAAFGKMIEHLFGFLETAFGEGQEMLIIVAHLTVNPNTSAYIGTYGADAYFRHNKDLLFHERQKELDDEIRSLDLTVKQ